MIISLGNVQDLLATIPYQIGFHPDDSVVVLVTSGRQIAFCARFDVPHEPGTAAVAVAGQCARLRWQIDQIAADGAILVLYDESALGWQAFHGVHQHLRQWGLEVALSVVVAGGLWREVDGRDPRRWGAWQPLPDPASSPGVAEFVGMGRVAAADRESAVAILRPQEGALRAPAHLSARECAVPVRAVNQWRDFFRLGPPDEANGWLPDPVGAIRLARSLLDRDFRDALIAVLVPGTIDPADLDRVAWSRASSLAGHVLEAPAYVRDEPTWDPQAWNAGRLAAVRDRFVRLARVCPAPISAGPYVVTALLAGRQGAGHIASAAIEQALIADPDHVLAQILSDLLDRGLLPGHQIGGGQRQSGAA